MSAFGFLIAIAFKDYIRDRRYGLVSALVLTSVLAPILVLFGIKNGIVEELFDRLRSDPTAVALRPLGQGQYEQLFIDQLLARGDVRYAIPTTRFLSSTIEVRNPENRQVPPGSGELIPSSKGDPLWGEALYWQGDVVDVVLSTPLLEKMNLKVGEKFRGRLGRFVDGRRQAVDISLHVIGVIPLPLSSRDLVLVPLPFLLAAEDYREGYRVAEFKAEGREKGFEGNTRTFASFRLYARSLEDVAGLRAHLVSLNVETNTALARINLIQTLDQVLSYIFWIVTGLAALGYALAASVQSSLIVIRKTPDLAVLKLLGFSSAQVSFFPVLQSLLTGLIGALGAIAAYYAAEVSINDLVGRLQMIDGVVASLPLLNALAAVCMTLLVCVLTSLVGGWRVSKIYPSEGVRHD
jgi:putative ABC transport system permease protein